MYSFGQRHEIKSRDIASLSVVAGQEWQKMPVLMLGGNERLNIDFDELSHDYRRLIYKIEHCEADWTVSRQLFSSDYCDGFADGNSIDDISQSINTTQIYTHYRLTLPNAQCGIKMSGNYKVTVYDGNSEEVLFTACFMVTEQLAGVRMNISSNTDIDVNNAHQQVSMELNYNGNLRVTDSGRQIKVAVLQNGRWSSAVWNPLPQYKMPDGLRWEHNKSLIFPGGNEYRKFEMLDMDHPTLGIEYLRWDGMDYHAYLWADEPRKNYVYDEDANGAFYIRNSDNVENDVASDYAWVHFKVPTPKLSVPVYLSGNWTYDAQSPQYEMTYNDETLCYEASVRMKEGYYNYLYMAEEDNRLVPAPFEGSFFQTENSYQVLVYYRSNSDRTDRLVAYQHAQFKK